jgi:hypothetical protein
VYFTTRGLPLENIVVANVQKPVSISRNIVIKDLVLPRVKRFEWFIFIDKDNEPEKVLTDPFLDDVPFDVVGCQYDIGDNKRAWLDPTTIHMGLCRVRAEWFPKLTPPWFKFHYNEDGTRLTSCECGHFIQSLQRLGATVTRRGYVPHQENNRTWHTGV